MTQQEFHDRLFALVQEFIDTNDDLKKCQGKSIVERDSSFDIDNNVITIEAKARFSNIEDWNN